MFENRDINIYKIVLERDVNGYKDIFGKIYKRYINVYKKDEGWQKCHPSIRIVLSIISDDYFTTALTALPPLTTT